jgi:hypothetical protein
MSNDFNTAGRAVYLPAVNSTFARTAVIADITDRPFPVGLTVDDLVYWQKNKLFTYPYLLHSIGLYKVGAVDDTAVSRIERGSAVVLGDSSGFQIGQGTLKGLDNFKANMPALQAIAAWNAAGDVRNWILNWLESYSTYAMTIDMPLWAAVENTSSPFSNCSREQLLRMTQDNLRYINVNKQGNTKWLNVVQGIGTDDTEFWWNGVKNFRFDGWALAGGAGSRGGLYQLLYAVLLMNEDDAFAEGLDWVHVLGVSTLDWAVILTALQKNLNKRNPALQVSFDTSSPFQSGMMREEAYYLPTLTTNPRTWVFPKKESPQGFDYIGSIEAFPHSCSPLGKLLELGHLNVSDVFDAGQRKQYDSISLMMLVNHDIWVTLKAIEVANDLAFGIDSELTTPRTLVDCIERIQEVFDIAFSNGDWRGYLSEHKSFFDAHSQSVYSE